MVPAQAATGIEKERLLKLLFFLDRLLFAVPPVQGSEQEDGEHPSLERVLSSRLHRFWRGGWDSVWREAHSTGAGARAKQQDASKAIRSAAEVRRIENLLQAIEESRAAGCVMKNSKMASGTGAAGRVRALFPSSAAVPSVPLVSETINDEAVAEFREKLVSTIETEICRYPRLSNPGPSRARFEHWGTLRYNEVGLAAAGKVLASLA